jgi:hypothetical protein
MTLSPVDGLSRSYFTLLTMSPVSPSGLTATRSVDLKADRISANVATFT